MASKNFLPDHYLHALGLVTATWAIFETSVDFIVLITFKMFERHPDHKEMPRTSMWRKIGYLNDISGLPQFASWRNAIERVATSAESLRQERHDAAHGAIEERVDDHTMQVFRVLHEKTDQRIKQSKVTADSLIGLAERIMGEGSSAADLARELFDAAKKAGGGALNHAD